MYIIHIYIIITKNIRYLLWNRGFWCSLNNTYLIFPTLCIWCTNHLCDSCDLTHWGRVTHICVGKLTIIGSDNGLSPGRRQAIIWTNAGILLIGPLGTNFSETLIAIETLLFKKMHLKISSAKWRPFCLVLNVLTDVNPHFIPSLLRIEPVSAFSLANNPGHSNENPIWWRWHGNTKSHAILPFGDV